MAKFDYDMAIIGAGSGGLSVAAGAAQLGLNVALIEKGEMGGDCLNYGCVPSKALIKSAKAAYDAEHLEKYGLRLKGDIDKSWPAVRERVKNVIATIAPHDSQERFEGLGAKVFRSAASFKDAHTVQLADGTALTAKTIIIATGSSPAIPDMPGLKDVGYQTNETIFTMEHFPKRLLVIGTGPIGCELGQSFSRLGSKVTILSRSGKVLTKDDPDITAFVSQQFTEEGIDVVADEVERFEKNGEEVNVKLKSGKILVVDGVLVAVGRQPNVGKLNLEAAGIEYSNHGIKVDKKLRTTQKHIYAIGDCNGLPQFTHSAGYQAGIVVRNAIFHLPTKYDLSVLPYATYTDPTVAAVGLTEAEAKEQGIAYSVAEKSFEGLDRAVTDGSNRGKAKILIGKKGRIIGASIVGPSAAELIHEIALAMKTGTKATTVTGMIHAYPTLSEINKNAISGFYGKKLFTDKVRKTLKLLFRYGG